MSELLTVEYFLLAIIYQTTTITKLEACNHRIFTSQHSPSLLSMATYSDIAIMIIINHCISVCNTINIIILLESQDANMTSVQDRIVTQDVKEKR